MAGLLIFSSENHPLPLLHSAPSGKFPVCFFVGQQPRVYVFLIFFLLIARAQAANFLTFARRAMGLRFVSTYAKFHITPLPYPAAVELLASSTVAHVRSTYVAKTPRE